MDRTCPHCGRSINASVTTRQIGMDRFSSGFEANFQQCPSCGRAIIDLVNGKANRPGNQARFLMSNTTTRLIHPRTPDRPVPSEVPPGIASDYREAALVLADSPKASAALSRRCLQAVLRARKYKGRNLEAEIARALEARVLPTTVAQSLDAVRQIGNFAAHPSKSEHPTEITDVEPNEAEWCLDVLDMLFDAYWVQEAAAKSKIDALNAKLEKASKPRLQQPEPENSDPDP